MVLAAEDRRRVKVSSGTRKMLERFAPRGPLCRLKLRARNFL
jgi:hypothetical protein